MARRSYTAAKASSSLVKVNAVLMFLGLLTAEITQFFVVLKLAALLSLHVCERFLFFRQSIMAKSWPQTQIGDIHDDIIKYRCDEQKIKVLVSLGLDVNASNKQKWGSDTLFSVATANIPVMQYLLKAGANVNLSNCSQQTPLIISSFYGRLQAVNLLLNAGADVNASDRGGFTALSAATDQGYKDIVSCLIKAGANLEVRNTLHYGATALAIAAQKGHCEIVRLLIQAGANVETTNTAGMTPLMWAAGDGHGRVVDMLLQAGANVNRICKRTGGTALMMAAKEKHIDIVSSLLEANAEVIMTKNDGSSPLAAAFSKGYLDILNTLQRAGADIEVMDHGEAGFTLAAVCTYTALHRAVQQGDAARVETLLKEGADPHTRDHSGLNALYLAKRTKQADLIALLQNAKKIRKRFVTQQNRQRKIRLISGSKSKDVREDQGQENVQQDGVLGVAGTVTERLPLSFDGIHFCVCLFFLCGFLCVFYFCRQG